MTDTAKLLSALLVIVLAAFLAWHTKIDASNWSWATVGALGLLFIERPISLGFGALTVSAEARREEAKAKAKRDPGE